MKLSYLISQLQKELETKGDNDTYFYINSPARFLKLDEVFSHPKDQDDGSWGIDSCWIKLKYE